MTAGDPGPARAPQPGENVPTSVQSHEIVLKSCHGNCADVWGCLWSKCVWHSTAAVALERQNCFNHGPDAAYLSRCRINSLKRTTQISRRVRIVPPPTWHTGGSHGWGHA